MKRNNAVYLQMYIRMMSTTSGRDKSLRFIQYIMMFLKGLFPSDRSDTLRDNIYYTAWLTRKVLRLGLPIIIFRKIIGRFKYLFDNPPNEIVSNLFTDKSESLPSQPEINDVIDNISQRSEGDRKYSRLQDILDNSSEKGSTGYITRMILTKTIKDLSFIGFCLIDVPLYLKEMRILKFEKDEGIAKLKKLHLIQRIFWLIQCISVIIYEMVELRYVLRDLDYLRDYLTKNKVELEMSNNIKKKMHQLKVNYYIRLYTLIHRSLDIPVLLYFFGLPIISQAMAGACGIVSSILVNLTFMFIP